jgi:hypothetical protein
MYENTCTQDFSELLQRNIKRLSFNEFDLKVLRSEQQCSVFWTSCANFRRYLQLALLEKELHPATVDYEFVFSLVVTVLTCDDAIRMHKAVPGTVERIYFSLKLQWFPKNEIYLGDQLRMLK